jgi:hypothetical protein
VTHPTDDLETRVHTALVAEAGTVEPAAGSLDAIRSRARTAHRRRRALAAGVAAAALVGVVLAAPLVTEEPARVDTDGPDQRPGTTEPPAPSTTAPPTTAAPVDTTDVFNQSIWPPRDGEMFTDPVEAARSFVTELIGIEDPPLSEFQAGEPGAGEVNVLHRNEGGSVSERIASTIVVRQLNDEHWFVTTAFSPSVVIDSPESFVSVTSPLTVTGQGQGFEGNVVVDLRARNATTEVLGTAPPVIAGAQGELEPFSVELPFTADTSAPTPIGVVVAQNDDPAGTGVHAFAAVGVHLPGGREAPPETEYEFGSAMLWPFRSVPEADQWLNEAAPEGHQPWHASPEDTALGFTQGYLGFTEIGLVTSTDIRADEAWIGVGYDVEPGGAGPSTAAVIHLLRMGNQPDSPWEVVGTRDTTLTLETPHYAADLTSPLTVGGTITGVDESLRVQVRQQSSPEPLGESCCVPAGGQGEPWDATVDVTGAVVDSWVTVVVSTGGHVQDVERFAITGLQSRQSG